jgi:hypothetical protein
MRSRVNDSARIPSNVVPFPRRDSNAREHAVSLTERLIAALVHTQATREAQFVWDDKMIGLGVRITRAGHKSYVVRYRVHRRQRLTTSVMSKCMPWSMSEKLHARF